MSLNQTSRHKSPRACEHKAFVVHHDVHRLAAEPGGPIIAYDFSANIFCFDCGMEFKTFRVRLEPTSSIMRAAPGTPHEAHTTKQ